MADPG